MKRHLIWFAALASACGGTAIIDDTQEGGHGGDASGPTTGAGGDSTASGAGTGTGNTGASGPSGSSGSSGSGGVTVEPPGCPGHPGSFQASGPCAEGSGSDGSCSLTCPDAHGNVIDVTCQGNKCDCNYNGQIICSCSYDNPQTNACTSHGCCPTPWFNP